MSAYQTVLSMWEPGEKFQRAHTYDHKLSERQAETYLDSVEVEPDRSFRLLTDRRVFWLSGAPGDVLVCSARRVKR